MNGKYQVGSGRVVTFTHDTPFIDDSLSHNFKFVNKDFLSKKATTRREQLRGSCLWQAYKNKTNVIPRGDFINYDTDWNIKSTSDVIAETSAKKTKHSDEYLNKKTEESNLARCFFETKLKDLRRNVRGGTIGKQ